MGARIPDNELPYCKYCLTRRVVRQQYKLLKRCDSVCCIDQAKYNKRNVWTGKKRPEHGKKVSDKLTNKPKTESHKKNLKTNTDYYKKRMLENKNIEYTDENFDILWRKLVYPQEA